MPILAALVVVTAIGSLQTNYVVDDGYIYAKFAACLADTGKWAFNCSAEPVYATTSPLWTMLLAAARLSGLDLSSAIPLLNCASALLLSAAISQLFAFSNICVRVLSAASIGALPLIWKSQGLEVVLAVALVAWAVVAFSAKREVASGLLLGFAILARPDSALVAPLLLAAAVFRDRRIPAKAILAASVIVAPWLLYAWSSFGTFIPETLEAKTNQKALPWWSGNAPLLWAALTQAAAISFLVVPLCVAAIVASCASIFMKRPGDYGALLFAAYGLLHGVAYGILNVPSAYFWYQLPFVIGALTLSFLGIAKLSSLIAKRDVALGMSVVLGSFLFAKCWSASMTLSPSYMLGAEYKSASEFIQQSASDGDRVAAAEIGYIGYFSGTDVLDIHALIHPEARQSIKAGNWLWWLDRSPEWIVLHSPRWYGEPGFRGYADSFLNDEYQMALFVRSTTGSAVEVWKKTDSPAL